MRAKRDDYTLLKEDTISTGNRVLGEGANLESKSLVELQKLQRRIERLEERQREARDRSASGNFTVSANVDGEVVTISAREYLTKADEEISAVIGESPLFTLNEK